MQFGAINTGRYQAGAVPQSTNMYSWPMNNYWVTNFNADQVGEMQWSYFINSSEDSSLEYATKFAWSNRIPFLTRVLPAGEGNDGTNQVKNILRINSENVLLVNMTPVENEKAVMLQLREIGGKMVDLSFSSDIVNIKKVEVCDVVGETVKGEQAALKLKPWESKFIKIYW